MPVLDGMSRSLLLVVYSLSSPLTLYRIVEADANGQQAINMTGAAINMHLAASMFVLHQPGAAGGVDSPAFKEIASDRDDPASKRQTVKSLAGVVDGIVRAVDGAAQASVIAKELSNVPAVNLVAGVLDAEEVHVREAEMVGVVKTKTNKRATETTARATGLAVPTAGLADRTTATQRAALQRLAAQTGANSQRFTSTR